VTRVSAFRDPAPVDDPDVEKNSGSAYPTTPGHFDEPVACTNA
jgi:hypothetical protein